MIEAPDLFFDEATPIREGWRSPNFSRRPPDPNAKAIPIAPVPEFHLDWKGNEIRVGTVVRHRYKPLASGDGVHGIMGTERADHWHQFGGEAPVIRLNTSTVVVGGQRWQIPVYLPCLLEVVR